MSRPTCCPISVCGASGLDADHGILLLVKTVFLSSTSRDLQAYRDAVYNALCQFDGWRCYRMESFTARSGQSALDYCREQASGCDVFVGLIGHCYGSIPPGESRSYTEREYEAASAVPRLMFVAPDTFPVPIELIKGQSAEDGAKLDSFRSSVLNGPDLVSPPSHFENPEKLANAVLAALRNWEHSVRAALPSTAPAGTSIGVDPRTLAPGSRFKDVDAVWCPELVIIPAGRFTMGSPDDDPDAYPEEKPAHEVVLDSFALGRYLVTFDQFDAFCAKTKRPKPGDEGWGRGQHPAINVCWNDARDFVLWLAAGTGKPYRLPTEAEWEYACRAGTTSRFYRGHTLSVKHANYDMAAGRTTPVGSYPANPWGLYDMLGNAWEHVEDPYHESYEGAPTDGSAWMDGGNPERRVVRGGSFSYSARDSRSGVRCDHDIRIPDRQHGFRVARSL
jgi:formylglycine-generating enzyme required for sulfatase activity